MGKGGRVAVATQKAFNSRKKDDEIAPIIKKYSWAEVKKTCSS